MLFDIAERVSGQVEILKLASRERKRLEKELYQLLGRILRSLTPPEG